MAEPWLCDAMLSSLQGLLDVQGLHVQGQAHEPGERLSPFAVLKRPNGFGGSLSKKEAPFCNLVPALGQPIKKVAK